MIHPAWVVNLMVTFSTSYIVPPSLSPHPSGGWKNQRVRRQGIKGTKEEKKKENWRKSNFDKNKS